MRVCIYTYINVICIYICKTTLFTVNDQFGPVTLKRANIYFIYLNYIASLLSRTCHKLCWMVKAKVKTCRRNTLGNKHNRTWKGVKVLRLAGCGLFHTELKYRRGTRPLDGWLLSPVLTIICWSPSDGGRPRTIWSRTRLIISPDLLTKLHGWVTRKTRSDGSVLARYVDGRNPTEPVIVHRPLHQSESLVSRMCTVLPAANPSSSWRRGWKL